MDKVALSPGGTEIGFPVGIGPEKLIKDGMGELFGATIVPPSGTEGMAFKHAAVSWTMGSWAEAEAKAKANASESVRKSSFMESFI